MMLGSPLHTELMQVFGVQTQLRQPGEPWLPQINRMALNYVCLDSTVQGTQDPRTGQELEEARSQE